MMIRKRTRIDNAVCQRSPRAFAVRLRTGFRSGSATKWAATMKSADSCGRNLPGKTGIRAGRAALDFV